MLIQLESIAHQIKIWKWW